MAEHWVREAKRAPIRELFAEPLGDGEVAYVFLGWAGILLRTKDHAIAFDLCRYNFKRPEVKEIASLDVHCYSHTHGDHWHPPLAKAIRHATGAPTLIEPAILEQLGTLSSGDVTPVRPGEPISIGDLTVRGVTGIHPRPITLFHVEAPELRVFHGADSDHVLLSEFPADLAFVPVGAPSPSCSPESAVAMARDVSARVVVAVHGAIGQLEAFRDLASSELPEAQVLIPNTCEIIKIEIPG